MRSEITNVEIKLSSSDMEKIRVATGLEIKRLSIEVIDGERSPQRPARLENLKVT